ncbi:MAG: hypothetical protein RLZZ156_1634 [Deinococcota bacterium]|jgi:hypothetical protein
MAAPREYGYTLRMESILHPILGEFQYEVYDGERTWEKSVNLQGHKLESWIFIKTLAIDEASILSEITEKHIEMVDDFLQNYEQYRVAAIQAIYNLFHEDPQMYGEFEDDDDLKTYFELSFESFVELYEEPHLQIDLGNQYHPMVILFASPLDPEHGDGVAFINQEVVEVGNGDLFGRVIWSNTNEQEVDELVEI